MVMPIVYFSIGLYSKEFVNGQLLSKHFENLKVDVRNQCYLLCSDAPCEELARKILLITDASIFQFTWVAGKTKPPDEQVFFYYYYYFPKENTAGQFGLSYNSLACNMN